MACLVSHAMRYQDLTSYRGSAAIGKSNDMDEKDICVNLRRFS